MKKCWPVITCMFLLYAWTANGQNKKSVDSLTNVIKDNMADSLKIAVYLDLAAEYWDVDSVNTFFYADKAIALSDSLSLPKGRAGGLYAKGWVRMRFGNYHLADTDFQQSLSIAEGANYTRGKANALKGLGVIYLKKRDYKEAEDRFMKSLKLNESLKDSSGIAAIYINLGIVSKEIGNLTEALEHYLYALKYSTDDKYKFGCYYNIASLYAAQNDLDNSLTYSEKALLMAKRVNNELMISAALRGLGQDYNNVGKYQKAADYLNEALSIDKRLNSRSLIASSFSELSLVFFNTKEYSKALAYCDSAYQLYLALDFQNQLVIPLYRKGKILSTLGEWKEARRSLRQAKKIAFETNNIEYLADATSQLSFVSAKLGLFEEAYENHVLHKQMYDSLINLENTKSITLLEADYQFQIERDSIEFANQQEKLILDKKIEEQRNANRFALLGIAALFIILFIFWLYYRSKQKANKLLQLQQEEITKKNEQLATLDRAKSRFFLNISHELRTPLTLISAPIQQVLKKGLDKPNTQSQLKIVLDNTLKLRGLIDDILDLSKLESDKIALKESGVAIHTFLQRVANGFESLALHLDITYEIDLEGLPHQKVNLDAGKAEKILNNLLSNALKNTQSGGTVQLKAQKIGDRLRIEVADTGAGIAPEDLPQIFDRYFQGAQPNTSLLGGTGIGLALAREFARLMGGNISVGSTLGEGSKFTLDLPFTVTVKQKNDVPYSVDLLDEPETMKEHELEVSALKLEKNYRVLVVEDHLEMKNFIEGLLQESHQVHTASSGRQAMDFLCHTEVDLIVTDVMMPEMDGFTLLHKLREDEKYYNVPVIMLTALNDEGHKLEALNIGVDEYLAKPFSPDELLARVKNMLLRYDVRKSLAVENEPFDEPRAKGNKEDVALVKKLETIILSEFENEEFRLEDIAEQFNLGERQFRRTVKRITGLSPKEYQQEVAMQKARELLEGQVYGNLTAVAYSVGIRNTTRFSEYYQRRYGKDPKGYFTAI